MKAKTRLSAFSTITIFLTLLTIPSIAQVIGGEQDKLFDMFLLEKYEDCYYKAFKMTEKEEFRADPEPYLYVSMCNLKLHEDSEMSEHYPNALKDALKYAAKAKKYHEKCLKKDIPTFSMEDNVEYYNELTLVALEECNYHFNEDKFSKSASWYKKLAKVEDNEDIWLAAGANMLLSRNMEGQKIIDEYWPKIQEKYKSGDVVPSEVTREALITGLLGYTRYLNENGESYKAKEIIAFAKELFPDNMKVDRKYAALHN